ncbi:tryptophan 2,3-dioxygenase [Nocardia sp. NBC_00511]|uniref:tryptophan 2,3-dioxygenase n=1 Tax=Nocardia sp. NBC_00511 TaxID=2903591 RepID=UPI002F918674
MDEIASYTEQIDLIPATEAHGCPLSAEPEQWRSDFSASMSYTDYLSLQTVLSAQHPLSPEHNEMLFIVQHQTTELWLKLVLHELTATLQTVSQGDLPSALRTLARVVRILEQLVSAWDVLATMTPFEYATIRPYLAHASGFQSHQYRRLEFVLGNKNPQLLRLYRNQPEIHQQIRTTLEAPSLYDEVIALLARNGFPVGPERLVRDWSQPTEYDNTVEDSWLEVYRKPHVHGGFYSMAETLVDLEDTLRQWRFRHLTTVERVIGLKGGTGGTEGVPYLRRMLDVTLFPELWHVRTNL